MVCATRCEVVCANVCDVVWRGGSVRSLGMGKAGRCMWCVRKGVRGGKAGCHLRGRHKGVGVVDAQHVVEGAGQLKGGAPHRTPHIQCQCVALLACKACCWLVVKW